MSRPHPRSRSHRPRFCKFVSLLCIAFGFTGMSFSASAAPPLKIGLSLQEMNNPYFVTMKKAAEEAAASIGATLIVTDARHDVAKQTSDVEDLIQKKIDILLLNPTDSVGIQSAVKSAKKAGIVVVTVDANAQGPVDSFVGSKNFDAGQAACTYLANTLKGKGDVAILDGIPVVPILERVRGCKAAFANFPGIKLVATQNGKQERDQALSVTENILQSHPKLQGMFSVNDIGALGALSAIESSGKDVKLVSVDGAPDAIKAILKSNAKFIATAAQYPRDQIRLALGVALAKKWGAATPAAVPVDIKLIDKAQAAGFSW